MGRLEGKTAIITGAGRGIGRAIAEKFAEEGASLLLVTLSTPLDPLIAELKDKGCKAEGIAGDVGEAGFAKEAISRCQELFGGVDILVNNAGVTRDGLLVRMKEDDFDEVLRVNLKGAFLMIQAVGKTMMKKRGGLYYQPLFCRRNYRKRRAGKLRRLKSWYNRAHKICGKRVGGTQHQGKLYRPRFY